MGETKLQLVGSATPAHRPEGKPSSPRSPRSAPAALREQVAAVCYRLRNARIQFLLVQTRKRRWTFPKGSIEPGLTCAQSAALEAFEEAGVHGRLEEAPFARYILRKRGKLRQADVTGIAIQCHLCEVLRLGPPQEADRNPTWFYPEKAKLCLKADRKSDNGDELARIVDRAVIRIQRLRKPIGLGGDVLKRVEFEASEIKLRRLMASTPFAEYIRGRKGSWQHPRTLRLAVNTDRRNVLRLGPAPPSSGTKEK